MTPEYACDVCGKPATTWAQDLARDASAWRSTVAFSPIGPPKKGCDDHPVYSETFDVSLMFRQEPSRAEASARQQIERMQRSEHERPISDSARALLMRWLNQR